MTDRERFEAWYDDPNNAHLKKLYEMARANAAWHAWQAATLATAQRCFELCDDPVEAQRIAAEFGLTEGDA